MPSGRSRRRVSSEPIDKRSIKPGTWKRVLAFGRSYILIIVIFLTVVIADSVVSITNPLIYRWIVNDGILKQNPGLVIKLGLLAGIFALLDIALSLAQGYLSSKIGTSVVRELRIKLFEHVQKQPIAFFTRVQTGSLVSRLNNDVSDAQTGLTDVLSNVVGNVITAVLLFAAMFAFSWKIALCILILFPIFILISHSFNKRYEEIIRERNDLASALNNFIVERFNVAGALLARLFGASEREKLAFAEKATQVANISLYRSLFSQITNTPFFIAGALASVLAYGWGGYDAALGIFDVGTVIALSAFAQRLYRPLNALANVQVDVISALVAFDRVFEILDLKPMIEEKQGAVSLPIGPVGIAFEDVSFAYPSVAEVSLPSLEIAGSKESAAQKEILHDVSFEVAAGTLTALVGPSGAGKTTITQLIPRLYDATRGAVKIGGLDVREATLDSLREKIGVVTQDAHLFHDTIRANLLYAKPDASDDEIWAALQSAQIRQLIEALPDKLDTMVGERGHRFSGGEKQRLAIARLLLKAPEIVILDEATAHLDSASEAAIQKAFATALEGRTSIVIAHRLSTVIEADQILVIEEGEIAERGRHEELLKNGGLYADLYRRQFADEK